MKTLALTKSSHWLFTINGILVLSSLLIALWLSLAAYLQYIDPTVGTLDAGVWQLLCFSFISFMLLLSSSILLFKWCVAKLALPTINSLVLQFKHLQLWQQFALYWASFALLFMGSLLSLIAIF